MDFKQKCRAINELIDRISHTGDQCYSSLYLHRIYLNFEELIEFYLAKNKIFVEHDGAYHKMILSYFINDIAKNGFVCEKLYVLLEELRGFRHIFVKRSDIWCFDETKLDILKQKLLKQKSDLSRLLEEIFYEV
jgi:hypothetical protein